VGKGNRRNGRGSKDYSLKICMGYGKLSLKNDERNGKICTHFICDVNGKWLKDLLHYYCTKCGR
jgi:hypothetical protein